MTMAKENIGTRREPGQKKEPRIWGTQLRRELEHQAFVEKYPCIRCGSLKNIHIHHLMYTGSKADFFNERFWVPLCVKCHGFAHSREYMALLHKEGGDDPEGES
jgi:hypothetical protein